MSLAGELPPDVALLKHPWRRRASDAWTSVSLRASVLTFLDGYIASRGWLNAWDVTERFTDNGVSVSVPRGPALLFDNTLPDDFRQRPGVRLLVLGVTRKGGGLGTRRLECALHFLRGNQTSPMELAVLLDSAGKSLDAEHRRQPIP